MTKAQLLAELSAREDVKRLAGEAIINLPTAEAQARGTTEADGTNWYTQGFYQISNGIIKIAKAQFIVFGEGTETEEAVYMQNPVVLTPEEVFEKKVSAKLEELRIEAEAKSRLETPE